MNIENLHGKKRYHEFNLIRANKLMQDGARAIGIGKGKIDGSTYVCFAVDEALLFLLQSYKN